jgi:small basic protein (TIGR04137 family)
MTLDRSLKIHGGLIRTRSVLTRAERIERLLDEGKFDPEKDSPFALPKVRVRHSKAGTKTKKEEKPAEVAEAEGAEAAEGAAEAPAAEN